MRGDTRRFPRSPKRMNESRRRRLRDRSSGTATLISEGCRITGTITGNCDFQVNGEVEGDCEIDSTLMLAKSGFVEGHHTGGQRHHLRPRRGRYRGRRARGDNGYRENYRDRVRRGDCRRRRRGRGRHYENHEPVGTHGIRRKTANRGLNRPPGADSFFCNLIPGKPGDGVARVLNSIANNKQVCTAPGAP